MSKLLGLCGLLLLATLAAGQMTAGAVTYQSPAGAQATQPVLVTPIMGFPTPIGPGGLVISGGYATTIAPSSAPLLVTPTAGFATVSSSPVGASGGTSNNQVGASNSTIASTVAPLPAVQTVFQINQPGGYYPAQPGTESLETTGPPAPTFNTGAARVGMVSARGYAERRSLGEMSRQWRQEAHRRAARVYTNDDVARVSQAQSGTGVEPQGTPTPKNPSAPEKRR